MQNDLYLTYQWLYSKGISCKTVKQWVTRKIVIPHKVNGSKCISYEEIPAPTRAKLPCKEEIIAELDFKNKSTRVQYWHEVLSKVRYEYFSAYLGIYNNDDLAGQHAVIEKILSLRTECRLKHLRFESHDIWKAFNLIFPERYAYGSFLNALNFAEADGIEKILIKKTTPVRFNQLYEKMVMDAMSSQKRYSQPQIHDLLSKACKRKNIDAPSLSWVKKCIQKLSNITSDRDGNSSVIYNERAYMGLIQAQNANSQWQIDGWRLPFYMANFETLTLFCVIDAYSRRVIGSYISGSENTETILKGLENAVNETKVLPHEIVSDNHSFNKTKEAEYFKAAISKYGVTWTVTSNPRQKTLIERFFLTFGNDYCKFEYGYTGQDIRSRVKNGRPSQELIDKTVKNPLTREQITAITGRCIEAYNNAKGKDGKSPNERYYEAVNDLSRCKKSFNMDELDIITTFTRRSEYIVRRGQITLERAGVKYEFVLNSEQYIDLNNKRVAVRYTSFDEIMMFDIKTDKYIGIAKRKKYAHAALADRTEADNELFFKHTGRLKGIKNKIKQKQYEITVAASQIDPDAAYIMNPLLTPKDTFEEYRKNGAMLEFLSRHDIKISDLERIQGVECEKNVTENRPERNKKSPFNTGNKEYIDLEKWGETD